MHSTAEIAQPDAKHAVLQDVFGFDTFRPGEDMVDLAGAFDEAFGIATDDAGEWHPGDQK